MELGTSWKATDEETVKELSNARLVCVNYEPLKKFVPLLVNAGLDALVLDESHNVMNPSSKRTQLILENKDRFRHRILLSGTPIKNEVGELSTQLEIVGLDRAMSIEDMTPGQVWNMLHESKIYLKKNILE